MAKRGQHSFLKRQKEIKRKEEAAEKMARRQSKGRRDDDAGEDKTLAFPQLIESKGTIE